MAKDKTPHAFLLTRDDGKAWQHSDWDGLVRDAASAAKLPAGVCLYSLRHAWITQHLIEGVSILDVARLTGTSLRMVDSTYGHLVPSKAQEHLARVRMV